MKLSEALKVSSRCNGANAARAVLYTAKVEGVLIATRLNGVNEYDPRQRIIFLSLHAYHRATAESIAIGAHEAGHAVQHARGYLPFVIRAVLFTPARVAALLLPLLFLTALIFHTHWLVAVVVAGYACLIAFHLLTLPIEADASNRGHAALLTTGLVEFGGADSQAVKRVLRSMLRSYVFSFLLAPLWLVVRLAKRQ